MPFRNGADRRRSRLAVAAVVVAFALTMIAGVLLAEQPSASASTVLTIIDGSVAVARGGSVFVPASDGELLAPGDRVRTLAGGRAVVTLFDGSTIEVEPSTTIEIEVASTAPDGSITIELLQTLGRTFASVQQLTHPDSRFEVRTPMTSATVRGTGLIVDVEPDGTSTVWTVDGRVEVTAQGATVVVPTGHATTVLPNEPPARPIPVPPPRNRLRFGETSPAYLAVVDPVGRTCGIVLPGPTVVRQTPACLTTGPGIEPQVVEMPDAPGGTYQLVFFSARPAGTYTTTITGVSGDAITFESSVTGTITGSRQGASLEVAAAADGTLTSLGITAIHDLTQSPIKVAIASPRPVPAATGTLDVALFAPLPTPTDVPPSPPVAPTPTATVVPSPTSALAPIASPTPTTIPLAPTPTPPPPTMSPAAVPSPTASPWIPPGRARTPKPPHCPPPKCVAAI